VQKWQIAAAGGGIGLILVIVLAVVLSGGKSAAGGGATGGGDEEIIISPVQAKKIVWAYHDGELTPFQQLCKETIEVHTGEKSEFEFKLLNKDDVTQHISKEDLPTGWDTLKPRYKRDAAINALLARNGGVALDLNTVMFRQLDSMWKEHIEDKGVAFKGFYYKSRAETATWFMMVGTEGTGIMQTALARQKKLSGDEPEGCMNGDKEAEICYGSSVVSYALCAYESKYCICYKEQTDGCELLKVQSKEADIKIDLTDPRKSVQSDIVPDKIPKVDRWQPMASTEVEKYAEEFANFKVLFNGEELPFISMQAPTSQTGELAGKSRAELLGDSSSFFYQWLCLAKHPNTDEDSCGE